MRHVSRFALVALIGGAAAACSETGRLASNPFSNPFGSQEAAQTASAEEAPAFKPVNRGSVTSAPLGAPGRVASAPIFNAPPAVQAPSASVAVASGNPAHRGGPAEIAGWSPKGGSPVTVGAGDTLATLSNRYGAPPQAILAANGLGSAAQVKPGTHLTIPVYAPGTASRTMAPAEKPHVAAAEERAAPAKFKFVEGKKPTEPRTLPKMAESRSATQRVAAADPKVAHPHPGHVAATVEQQSTRKVAEAKPIAQAKPAQKVAAIKPAEQPVKVAEAKKPVDIKTAETPKKTEAKVAEAKKPTTETKVAALAPTAPIESPKAREIDTTASLPKNVVAPVAAVAAPAPAAAAVAEADFRWPAHGRVISGFGGSGANEGINIAVPDGTPVKAAEGGTVAYAGSEVKGYGNLVLIRHDNGYVSAYAHNGEIEVKRGQKVARGQTIAKSGQSGNVTSPQIHFELRKGSTPVDPMPHLASN